MSRELELERLISLPLEAKASEQIKKIRFRIPFTLFAIGFVVGLVYWFGDDFIFTYKMIGPFWGFVIYTLIGISIAVITTSIFNLFWKPFNKQIRQAREEILSIINSGQASEEEEQRYRKIYIEAKIGDSPLTEEEFEWHSSRFCWGCGEEQTDVPMPFVVHRERTEEWQDGVYKYRKTFEHKATILICPKCHERLTKSMIASNKNEAVEGTVLLILVAIVVITTFIVSISMSKEFGTAIIASIIAFFASFSIGRLILMPLAYLISRPFVDEKDIDSKTKWSFEEIPSIRHFMEMNLPHDK